MGGGLGGWGGPCGVTTVGWLGLGRGPVARFSICAGADSAEKMFLPVPAYSTSSLCASLSKCSEGSRPVLVSYWASPPCVFWPAGADTVPAAGLPPAAIGTGAGVEAPPKNEP